MLYIKTYLLLDSLNWPRFKTRCERYDPCYAVSFGEASVYRDKNPRALALKMGQLRKSSF